MEDFDVCVLAQVAKFFEPYSNDGFEYMTATNRRNACFVLMTIVFIVPPFIVLAAVTAAIGFTVRALGLK